jgi:nicrotizing toxin Mtb-like protein
MGIQLPPELVDVAAKAGVTWPEADEDKMRTAAAAWRDAGNRITGLAGDSDGSATKALTGITGATGDAARKHWNGVVAPDGDLDTSAKGCHAAADRLEHGADQIGAAKVELVRELVNLAKNTDAAQSAASAGHPAALLGLDTALAGASANVTHLTSTLTSSVRLDSGVDVGATTPPVNANPGSHPGGGLLDTVVGTVDHTVGAVTAPVTAAVPVVTAAVPAVAGALPVAPLVDTVTHDVVPAVTAPVTHAAPVLAPVVEAVPAATHAITAPLAGGTELPPLVQVPQQVVTAPLPATPPIAAAPQFDIAPVQHAVDVPPAAVAQPLVSTTDGTVAQSATLLSPPPLPTETLAPQPVQQAPAAPPVQAPTQAPSFGPAAPAAPTAPVAPAAPAAGGAVVGAVQRTDQSPLHRLGDQSGTARGADQPGQRGPDQPGRRGSDQPGQRGADQRGSDHPGQRGTDQAAAQQRTEQKSTAAPQSSQQPAASTSSTAPTGKEAKKPDDTAATDLFGFFYLRAFPRGSNPPPSTRPTQQIEPTAAEVDHGDGLRFPPQDHPHADLVTAAASRPFPAGRGLGPDHPIVRNLTDGYDPQAGLHEREWDARFLRADRPVWPPAGTFPEGGYEAGRPDVLPAGLELDRFGTPEGRVLSERGTPFAARSLPPSDLAAGYHRYVVSRPIPVWRTISIGWFGQPGGATRYRTTYPVADLVALGYLMELS